jgi:S-adenosylmethionine:tRNA ribosyltransferase-isomerase
MIDPGKLSINDYTYSLPEERIAKYPLAERDASKLLIYKDGIITEAIYKNITESIPENSFLIFNNSKVVEARLLFQKPSGGLIEIFCLEPHDQYVEVTTAMQQKESVKWKCLVGGASKWKHGQVLEKKIQSGVNQIILYAVFIEKTTDSFIIEFTWVPGELSFAELLHDAGAIPLPPYIKRPAEESDKERYQTVYASSEGSVAAPTAGLHFTNQILETLNEKNIQNEFVTLHVGAGTFKPVKSDTMLEHVMHAEFINVSKTLIENIIKNSENNIVAVGTTSLRTIESLYWLGVKMLAAPSQQYKADPDTSLNLLQWEAYVLAEKNIPVIVALKTLLEWMEKNRLERLIAKTHILIAPGYQFKIVNGLVTNFHQPQSTLLLLIASFIGKDWKNVYIHALENSYRFLSYGDGCLLWRKKH